MKEQAIALKDEYRQNWATWGEKQRRNFINRCKRLAAKVNPNEETGDDCVAMIALDIIETRSGRQIWKR